ncbi:hypothetical protein PLICRDRAFT_137107 [Plicaturopsis crispa FD-325 SS-3]|nr:hypothetical protein PLICRDRAFT_137107 [Plicaturopsis crispa FD-325 SS-3]
MHWLKRTSARQQIEQSPASVSDPSPAPAWTPAPENIHAHGKVNEASEDDCEAAISFCLANAPDPPKLLSSDIVDRIKAEGCKAWSIQVPRTPHFAGEVISARKGGPSVVQVKTSAECKDTCLLSDLPIMGGLYQRKKGVYYEILVHRMDGVIAIGTSCLPYPEWRMPGWNRMSAGFHLDDFRKFFEDSDGGRDYVDLNRICPGDTIGCGYEFASSSVFFTYNGQRLPPAFTGVYLPHHSYDVYAAIGVDGLNEFEVNFGGEFFRWQEGNEWDWRVEGHIGRLSGSSGSTDEELPSYSEILS